MTDMTVDVPKGTEEQTEDEIWDEMIEDAESDDARDADAEPEDADDPDQVDDSEDQDEDAEPEDASKAEPDKADAEIDPDAQIKRLEHLISTDEGRIRARQKTDSEKLRRRIADHKAKLDALKADSDDSNEDQIKTLEEDYPDIAGPLVKSQDAMNRRISALTEIEEGEIESAETELKEVQEREWGSLLKEHPDFVDFMKPRYEEFEAWVDDQPRKVRDLRAINADGFNDGASAALLVSMFKRHLSDAEGDQPGSAEPETDPPPPSKRQRQLAGARTTQSRPAAVTSAEPDPNSDDLDAIWDSLWREEKRKGKV